MMGQIILEDVLPMFKYLSFTEYEARAYIALLRKSASSPTEVAEVSGIRRNQIYDVLKSLEQKGGVILLKGSKKQYEPVKPNLLIRRAMQELERNTEDLKESIAVAEDKLTGIAKDIQEITDDVDYVRILKDPNVIANEIVHQFSIMTEEYLLFSANISLRESMFHRDHRIMDDFDAKFQQVMDDAIRNRGVIFRVINTLDDLNHKFIEVIRDQYLGYDNVDLRIVDKVPCKVMLFDRASLFVGLKSKRNTGYSLLSFHINDRGLGEIMRNSFYSYFDAGISMKNLDIDVLLNEEKIVRR